VPRVPKVQIQTSSSSSEEDIRLFLQNAPDRSSHDSEDASDSTITPPTITDTSSKDKKRVTRMYAKKHDNKRRYSPKNDAPRNSPQRSSMKTKDLVEKTIIARGDQMSNETYKVIKSMQTSSKDGASINYERKSPRTSLLEELYLPPEEETYTEDFISEIRTLNGGSEGSFIEVPKTESSIEKPVTEDFVNYSNDEETIDSNLRSASLSLVEEIRTNLQSLELVDRPSKATQILTDAEDTDNPLNEFPDDYDDQFNGDAADISVRSRVKDLRKGKSNQDGDGYSLNGKSSITESFGSTRSKSFYSKKVSYREPRNNKNAIPKSSEVSLDKSDGGLSTASFASGSRLSETQSFQLALAKIHLDDEDTLHSGDSNGNITPSKLPAKTKPQIKIHQILKQEVYAKELKRLRVLRKKEEKILQKLNAVKAENYMKVKASEAGIKNYLQPNYTDMLKKPSKESPSPPPQSSALVLHTDVPRSSTMSPVSGKDNAEHYRERVSKMDLKHLVQEVVASNERMYNMTIAAAHDMAKQHGKDAKLLMKIKRKREEKLRK